jgi:ribokinase
LERTVGRSGVRRATIRDVAQLASVSVGTVSHVLNDSKAVSESARRAVQDAVKALEYRPNSLARSLIARRPRHETAPRGDRPRLICVGYISIDYMVRIGQVPQPGERSASQSIEKMLGGPAANVAAFAAALGEPLDVSVEMVTHLGDDVDSLWALEELAAKGIDASGALQQQGGRLSRCIVLVEGTGQRTIINEPFNVPLEFLARHLSHSASEDTPACVHFDGFHLSAAEQVSDELHSAGYLLSLHSAGLSPSGQTLKDAERLLATFDLLVLTHDVFSQMIRTAPKIQDHPSRIFECASKLRCKALLVTRGAQGAVLLRPEEAPVTCEAPKVDVVDATGAGDAFAGIFLASWLATGNAGDALSHAVKGASISITALGAQGRLARASDVGSPRMTEKAI